MKGIFILYTNDNKSKKIGIQKLNYKKEKVIEESITLFNDNDPCIIHQTYAINSLAFKLIDEIIKLKTETNKKIKIEDMPLVIKEYIIFDDNVIAFEIL